MAGKRTQPAADVPPVEEAAVQEAAKVDEPTTPADPGTQPAADVPPVETNAAPGQYETKVVEPAPRNRVLDLTGQPIPVPVGHVHSWERGRREDGTQMFFCACGAERPR